MFGFVNPAGNDSNRLMPVTSPPPANVRRTIHWSCKKLESLNTSIIWMTAVPATARTPNVPVNDPVNGDVNNADVKKLPLSNTNGCVSSSVNVPAAFVPLKSYITSASAGADVNNTAKTSITNVRMNGSFRGGTA